MIKDYELLQNTELLLSKRLVIWGVGKKGVELAEMLHDWNSSIEFVDSDTNKSGTVQGGSIPVRSPEYISEYERNGTAIVLSTDDLGIQQSILAQIYQMGYQNIDVYTRFAVEAAIVFQGNNTSGTEENEQSVLLLKKIKQQDNVIGNMGNSLKLLRQLYLVGTAEKSVYIYQPKKVGSVTLVNSVKQAGVYGVHVHSFLNCFTEEKEQFIRNMIKVSSGRIISVVREPVARQISLLWQYWGKRREAFLSNYSSLGALENSFYSIPNKEDEFEWFKDEFQRVLNINIYDYPFDRDLGYSVIEKDGISVLLLKLEKMNLLGKVIGDFLEISDFKLTDSNIAKDKEYYYAYQDYLEHVRIPLRFWEHYYKGNRYMDHFYSEGEKDQFYKRWKHRIAD